jgi:hypothetical protein
MARQDEAINVASLLASFPTAQINGRRGEIDFLKEHQQSRGGGRICDVIEAS